MPETLLSWSRDLGYALRRIGRSPGLALAVVLSLGLGIGVNATVFAAVSRFLLRPAPVGHPGALLSLYSTEHGAGANAFSEPVYNDVRAQAHSFSGVAALFDNLPASLDRPGGSERIWGQAATANFFAVAQVPMSRGRGFARSEERASVAVLSHRLWRQRFDADPAILGKSITLSGHPYTVVGVAPASFHSLENVLDSAFWVPLGTLGQLQLHLPDPNQRDYHWLDVIARLKPGVTRSQAAAELQVIAQRLAQAHPKTDKDGGFRFTTAGSLPPRLEPPAVALLTTLLAIALLVLAIAGANVINLFLAQAEGRRRETAVRLALGASRARLLRPALLESLLLSLGGGVLGLVLARWAAAGLSALRLPVPVPINLSLEMGWRVYAYVLLLSLVCGLLCGLAAAWSAIRPRADALRNSEPMMTCGRRWRRRDLLVVAQIAASLVLLCAIGLFLRSLHRAAAIQVGFRSHGILMLAVDPPRAGYTPEHTVQFLAQLRQRVAALPGVESVASTNAVPLSMDTRSDGMVAVDGSHSAAPPTLADRYMVSPDYFETVGIAFTAGRNLAEMGAPEPRIAVVNQVFAQKLFPGSIPIGRQVDDAGERFQIVGVVRDTKSRTLGESPRPILYGLLAQNLDGRSSLDGYTLLIHSRGDLGSLANQVRGEIHAVDPGLAIYNQETMQEHLHTALALPRLAATLFGVFAVLGLTLAAVGLYGVMRYAVSRRTREIGIRLALGARVGDVQWLIVGHGMKLTLLALLIGLPAALAASKLAAGLLYGIPPHDWISFTLAPLALTLVALLACWLPARRAAYVDPAITLRCE